VVPLPESIPDDVGAQLMINAVTALTVSARRTTRFS